MLEIDIELRRGRFQRHVRIVEDARVLALTGPSGAGKTSVLYAIAGADDVSCRGCGARWDVEASRHTLRRHIDATLATPAEIASMALRLYPHLQRHRVRHLITVWASRGHITRRGHSRTGDPTYRVGDVLARLATTVDRVAS